jgi:hypothetical protein
VVFSPADRSIDKNQSKSCKSCQLRLKGFDHLSIGRCRKKLAANGRDFMQVSVKAKQTSHQVTASVVAQTVNSEFDFIHKLPAFHNVDTSVGIKIRTHFRIDGMEVTDKVIESVAPIFFDQTEDHMQSIKAVFGAGLGARNASSRRHWWQFSVSLGATDDRAGVAGEFEDCGRRLGQIRLGLSQACTPSKSTGPVYAKAEAEVRQKAACRTNVQYGDDWRQIVQSAQPTETPDMASTQLFLRHGVFVTGAGGCGNLIVSKPDGCLIVGEAVIGRLAYLDRWAGPGVSKVRRVVL